VFGVPHADLGEEVMAVVVVESDLTAEQLKAQMREKVASFSVPTRWRVQTEPLPTNHTGKVDKPAISAQARAQIQAEQTA
jgi:acyl-CoA synthetase (AMP-forming)/AMP-acid ligase II